MLWLILSSGWIRVAANSILRLTRVLLAGYELQLIPSYDCLDFRRLDTIVALVVDSSLGG